MKKADALVADFRKDYKSMTHTFDTIVEQDLRNAISKYSEAIEYGIAVLMDYGVDYIDFDGLLNLLIIFQTESIAFFSTKMKFYAIKKYHVQTAAIGKAVGSGSKAL